LGTDIKQLVRPQNKAVSVTSVSDVLSMHEWKMLMVLLSPISLQTRRPKQVGTKGTAGTSASEDARVKVAELGISQHAAVSDDERERQVDGQQEPEQKAD
jgi:hypothetical protein